jgi:paraquat-inducible protein B
MTPSAPAVTPPAAPPLPARRTRRRAAVVGALAVLAVAAGLAGVWAYYRSAKDQYEVVVTFGDAHGLRVGADVRHRGVIVGKVNEVRIRPDAEGVEVRITLQPQAERLARAGSNYYIVRPTVSLNNGIRGLDTAIGDVYVEVTRPVGLAGARQTTFEGSEELPLPAAPQGSRFYVLKANRRTYALRPGGPITCGGFEIGQVRSVELADDGRSVKATFSVDPKYCGLLNSKTGFAEPNAVKIGIQSGISVDFNAILNGIVVTPSDRPGKAVEEGAEFELKN